MVGITALPALPYGTSATVKNAHRFLKGAHSSVNAMFGAAERLAIARRAANGDTRGRMAHPEVDLLRSAIVFTSSGLGASMKRLVTDAGRYLITRPQSRARDAYERQLKQWLSGDGPDEELRTAIASSDPTTELLRYYLAMKTKSSFQGSGDLRARVKNTLGLSNESVPDESLQGLDRFFVARNSIVHSMDYREVETSTGRARVHRAREEVTVMCGGVFLVAHRIILATARVVSRSR